MTRRTTWFAVCALAVAAINVEGVRALVALASSKPTSSHVLGIPFVSLVLVYLSRDSIFARVQPNRVLGACLVLTGLAVSLVTQLGESPVLSATVVGMLLSWVGAFVLCFGLTAARVALFPLAFLLFMIPIPPRMIDLATGLLKRGSADAVGGLFSLTGTPFHRDGFVFSIPSLTIEIADECSGIRSSIALLLTSLLAGHRFLVSSWTKIVLIIAILPIAFLKNAVRITTLSLLAVHVDESFIRGQLHHEGGIVFFLMALSLLVPLFVLLRWCEGRRSTVMNTTS